AEKSGMFARTVVVQCIRFAARPRHRYGGGMVVRPVAAAFQRCFIQPCAPQHRKRRLGMQGLAGMRRASQSQLTISKSISVRRTALDQRQSLNELYRRAGKDRSVRLPDFPYGFSVAIKN